MKVAWLLAACCLFLGAYASPIATVESAPQEPTPVASSTAESGRQAAVDGTNPVAPAATDDDDDDDDDDDVDLDITDDDDDDDESDEAEDDDDDDDEDYFERFFDDILGDDDDDDDDDTKPPAAAASPPVQQTPQQTVIQQPQVSRPSLTPDYSNLDYTAPGESLSAESGVNGESSAVYDDVAPEEQAAGVINHQDDNLAGDAADSVLDATPDNTDLNKPEVVQPVSTSDDDDDDDDDDDEDDLDVSLEEDDDDDDDDEEDDDEDDDDDDDDEIEDVVGDDVIEAKRARSLEAGTGSAVPPVYITKYNRFVDNIMERINRILRKNYDPVNVRLHNNNNNNNNDNKNKNKVNNSKKNNKNRRRRPGGSKKNKRPGHRRSEEDIGRSTNEPVEVTMNESLAAISAQLTEGTPMVSPVNYNATEATSTTLGGMATTTELATTKRSENGLISRARPNHHRRKNNNNNNNKKNKKNKNKGRQRPVARATLYGLSSLRREGDVTVNMMSSHTTLKTKFTLGPLILKVEKEFGRGAKKDIRSATATTTEMVGKLNLRVMHGGAATLHSIRVMQPKQVRVESSDDHDKTREYVWKRSSHIAHVVSQKLTNATRSMLQPPPLQSTSFLG